MTSTKSITVGVEGVVKREHSWQKGDIVLTVASDAEGWQAWARMLYSSVAYGEGTKHSHPVGALCELGDSIVPHSPGMILLRRLVYEATCYYSPEPWRAELRHMMGR